MYEKLYHLDYYLNSCYLNEYDKNFWERCQLNYMFTDSSGSSPQPTKIMSSVIPIAKNKARFLTRTENFRAYNLDVVETIPDTQVVTDHSMF